MLIRRSLQIVAITGIILVAAGLSTAQRRVTFARGRTSASVSGRLARGAAASFVVRALRGQLIDAQVSSGNGRVNFGGSQRFSVTTDRNGDYFIDITNGGGATTYTLTIYIR